MTAALFGIEWRHQSPLYGDYPAALTYALAIIEAAAPSTQAPQAFVSAHALLGLTRMAAGRDGIGLLRRWYAPALDGTELVDLTAQTWAWLHQQHICRRAALERLQGLCAQIRTACPHGADLSEVEEVEIVIEDRLASYGPALTILAGALPPCASSVELVRAARAFALAYPCRDSRAALYCDVDATRALPGRSA